MSSVFGADATTLTQPAAGWFGGQPPDQGGPQIQRSRKESPMVKWARETRATLKRERQAATEDMRRNTNLARGGTPWWRDRPKWKIGTKLNFCATVPLTWTAILCDAKPSVSYSTIDPKKQYLADLATAAWNKAFTDGMFEKKIHDCILNSRVQKSGYLRLTFDPIGHGGKGQPVLKMIRGMDVYMDRNASNVYDAEIIHYDTNESYGSICARYPHVREKLQHKYERNRDQDDGQNASLLAFPASYTMPTGLTVTTPSYAGSPNPPDSASGSSGLQVWEFWTRPRKTVEVDRIQWLSSGDPATRPKMFKTIDPADAEPMRRIVTEGNVIYEVPESIADALAAAQGFGGIKILSDVAALECITEPAKYPLYPNGRLVTIVDQDIEADDRMSPLGYIPFVQISANSDPAGGQYGPCDVDLIADVYEQLVRLVSLVHDNANLAGNSIWRIPIAAEISNDDITNAPASIQREDLLCLKYGKREPAPDMPPYIANHIKFLVDQIKELSGLSDVMLGKMAPKQQISTETMSMHQEASGVRFRDGLSSVSEAMQILGEQFLELMARFYTEPVVVQVKNAAGVREGVPFLGTYLTEPFVVEAKAGSRQPNSPSARLNTMLNMKNAGVPVSIDTVFALLEEIGSIPSAAAAMRLIETQRADPKQAWKVLGLAQPGQQQSKKPGSRSSKKQGAAAG
jgi:hypothetical protein